MSKFKNYRNKYTKNNIIHSIDHLSDMNFGEVSKRRKELTSQYKQIGLPTNSELQNSSNVVYVHEYTKDDGTFVHAHWRSKPEGTGYDDQGSDPVTPDKMPTKRPEPYPDDSGDDDENGGTVYNLLKWLLIILQAYQLMKSMGNDGNNFVPVNINDSLNNRTDSDYIPNLGVNDGVNDGVNKEINTSIDDKKSLKDIENLIIPREEHSSPFSITPYVPKKDEPVQNTQKNLTTNNKVSADKNQPVLTFEGAKQSELQPISQPMAQHSDDDLKRYIEQLLKPATNDVWGDLISHINISKESDNSNLIKTFALNFNADKNKDKPDAKQLMDIALRGIENYDDNSQFRLIPTNENDKLNNKYNLTGESKIPNKMKGIIFNQTSDFAKRIVNSKEFKKQIMKYYNNETKTFTQNKIPLEFKYDKNLFLSIGHCTLLNPYIDNNGYFHGILFDIYDFNWQYYYNYFAPLYPTLYNNIAILLHLIKHLEYYYYFVLIKFKI